MALRPAVPPNANTARQLLNLPAGLRLLSTESYSGPAQIPWRPTVALDEWVQKEARPVSLRQLTYYGRTLTESRLITSANYVRTELPVRLAHRLREMQKLPYAVLQNQHLLHVYDLYYKAFDRFRKVHEIRTLDDNDRFCKTLRETLKDHLTVIPRLAMGVLEVQGRMKAEATDKFMVTMLRSRISRRVIAEQHLSLSETFHEPWHFPDANHSQHDPNQEEVGEILLRCNAKEIVERCAEVTRKLMLEQHGPSCSVPEVKIKGHFQATFPYILSHVEYMIGELLRNSMQAMLEQPQYKDNKPPPIEVLICETGQQVLFRICDRGGGIPKEILPHLWSFSKGPRKDLRLQNLNRVPKLAATLQEVQVDNGDAGKHFSSPSAHIPHHGPDNSLSSLTSRPPNLRLGVGLPMSRIYAGYWAGSLEIHSLEGYGVDAFLQISKLGNKNEQLTTRANMDSI
ncbi:branched-chain alpha-ketoacid dehydrogenase [Venturia nashicola]|uniref:Protein-serine/threonine kinase n=1 Tax=Venturia nashicola TaxID=86259 RepID=A0A4Z1PKV9_9PEZI|nr:branched-chain alpha-ketoacid dehydrogenase [Venturia nashicola]